MNLIVLLGQTCSGKSDLSLQIADFLGKDQSVIVNCDSRQIYKLLNIGTAKVPGKWLFSEQFEQDVFFYNQVAHFLIDYVDPKIRYDLASYISDWVHLVDWLETKNVKNVILTGGTGLFAKSILHKFDLGVLKPEFQPIYNDYKQSLNQKSLDILQQEYSQNLILNQENVDSGVVEKSILNQSDYHNPRRLQNWLLRDTAKKNGWQKPIIYPEFASTQSFWLVGPKNLKDRIEQRVYERIDQGLLAESKHLLELLGYSRMQELGLEYKLCSDFLEKKLDEKSWKTKLVEQNWQYAKRQKTWLQKEKLEKITNLYEVKLELSQLKN